MRNKKDHLHDHAHALQIQRHQVESGQLHLGKMSCAVDVIHQEQLSNDGLLDQLLAQAQQIAEDQGIAVVVDGHEESTIEWTLAEEGDTHPTSVQPFGLVDSVDISDSADWATYLDKIDAYAKRQRIERDADPFANLMADSQRISLEKRLKDEFSLKKAACDKYDYMIAGTCGMIGGLVDVFFVGVPGKGMLGRWADDQVDNVVKGFAKLNGWRGADNTASAIGFLERKFRINYDHATTSATGGLVGNMSMNNHHVKSLGHSPDLVGLFFSLIDQFTNTAHFVNKGKLISVNTENFELSGNNFIAKIFAGFVNWLGHLFSDVAGSSGGRGKVGAGRGSGIPIPFYSLLQFVDVGSFGQHRQTFSTVAVKVFEQGYDMRHGIAMAIPVLIAELLTRTMWAVKQRFYHRREWRECIPSAGNPELRRMLLIAHGTLCLIDCTDATIRSGGDIVMFLARSNLLAWAKFGTGALKELKAYYATGSLDIDAIDEYIDSECARMLAA